MRDPLCYGRDRLDPMTLLFTARIPGELRHRDIVGAMLSSVCERVESATGRAGLAWQVLSAYNEAFNNVVRHAYATARGDVEVTLQVDDDRVTLRLVDHGEGFDFARSGAVDAPPEFDRLSEGGMGLFIIRKLMSEVSYERRHGRNHLTMTKRLAELARGSRAPEG
jgi:serine/threonine-protein kinase RsbW